MAPSLEMLRYEHAAFPAMAERWRYVRDVYAGAYVQKDKVQEYLHRRGQGEHEMNYEDRVKNLDPSLLLANLFGKIVGQLRTAASSAEINWAEGSLGDASDPASRAYQLVTNVDGTGTNLSLWRQELELRLLQYEDHVFVLVDGPTEPGGPVRWLFIEPDQAPDWLEQKGRFAAIKVRHRTEERAGLWEKPVPYVNYTLYAAEGFERYRHKEASSPGEDVQVETVSGDGAEARVKYDYFASASGDERRLPIVDQSLRVKVAHLLARKEVAILNRENERDNLLRTACTVEQVETEPEDGYVKKPEDPKSNKQEGGRYHVLGYGAKLEYIAPPSEPALLMSQVLEEKRRNFFILAWQEYEDQAAQKTATEIRQDSSSGREAFLSLLAAAADEVVNTCLFLTEQIEHPAQRSQWGRTKLVRTGSFRPATPQDDAERDRTAYYGAAGTVPLTEDAEMAALRQQYEARGLPVPEDDELRAFVQEERLQRKVGQVGGLAARTGAGVAGRLLGIPNERMRTDDVPEGEAL